MSTVHCYEGITVTRTGNQGEGTSTYTGYSRDHQVTGLAPQIDGSSDPAFRGDPSRWNPEQLLLVSLSQCHMLWYLHLAMQEGVSVTAYKDQPTGIMTTDANGAGRFTSTTLHPHVTISATSDPDLALAVHARVPEFCFIARSVNFPVTHEPVITREKV